MARQTKKGSSLKSGASPWWIDHGEEDCPHCAQTYSYSAEIRCFSCDAPICPMCIVRVGENRFCPECSESAQEEA